MPPTPPELCCRGGGHNSGSARGIDSPRPLVSPPAKSSFVKSVLKKESHPKRGGQRFREASDSSLSITAVGSGAFFLSSAFHDKSNITTSPAIANPIRFMCFLASLLFQWILHPYRRKKFTVGYTIIKFFRKKEHHSEDFPSDAFFVILSDIFTPEQLVKSHAKQAGDGDE